MRLRRLIRQIHRWLGLLVGAQVLLWIFGGAVMSMLRLDEVRGENLARRIAPSPLEAAMPLVPIAEVLASAAPAKPASVTLTTLLGRPVYQLNAEGRTWLVDARSGAPLSPLGRELAEAVARADYAGEAPLVAVESVDQPGSEYRGHALPLWRVRFADERDTTLYISPETGKVVARRNELWRVFDFVWMLHIMDYEEREDFNHPLLITAATTALLFALSGIVMLGYSFLGRRAS